MEQEQEAKPKASIFKRLRKVIFTENTFMMGLMLYDLRFVLSIFRYHYLNRHAVGHDGKVFPIGVIERDGFVLPQVHAKNIIVPHMIMGSAVLLASIHNLWTKIREANIKRHKFVGKMYLLTTAIAFLPALKMSIDWPHTKHNIIRGIVVGLDILWFLSSYLTYYYMGHFGGKINVVKHQQWAVRSASYAHTVPLLARVVNQILYKRMGYPNYYKNDGHLKLQKIATMMVPINLAILLPLTEILTYYHLPVNMRKYYTMFGL